MTDLISDSTFYLFFIDDISKPLLLKRILKRFRPQIPSLIKEELERKGNANNRLNVIYDSCNFFKKTEFNIGDVLKPFFSEDEKRRGEHEVIIVSYICDSLGLDYISLIDDKEAYNFIRAHVNCILHNCRRSGRFIVECSNKYKIFNKTESLEILDLMLLSKFNIKKCHIDALKNDLKNGRY